MRRLPDIRSLLLAGLFVVLASVVGTVRSETATIDPAAERIDLSARLGLLHDPQGRLQPADVRQRSGDFRPATRNDLAVGFNAGVYWLRIPLLLPADGEATQAETRWLAVGTAKTQRVTLYAGTDANPEVQRSGRIVAVQARPLQTMDPVFPLRLQPGKPLEVLLRVETRGTTNMAPTLWQPEAYRHEAAKTQMQLTAILGGLLLSGGLGLVAFVALREYQYLWQGLIMLALAGLEATRTNFLSTYLWDDALGQPAQLLAFFAALAMFGLSKVVAHLLELAAHMPRANRLLFFLRWAGVAGALYSLADYGTGVRLLSVAAATQNLVALALCVLAWRRGQAAAGFFLLVFTLALLTETTRQFANLGLLPWIDAMEFSTFLFLLASPLILFGLIEQTRRLSIRLQVADELQQAKSAFLARVSHELRSPLNTVLGLNRMLARRSPKIDLAEGTAGIEKSVLRLLRLIDELLDEARTAAGKLTIRPAALALQPWLDEIAQLARAAIEGRGNRLECDFDGTLAISVEADGERLRQVLENLLANANRHTERGTIRLTCHVSPRAGEAMLDFAVTDDGEGIPAGYLRTIFEPFERGKPASLRKGKGFGLGLSICRELLRQMGSDIAVASAPERGSRFSFSLRCPLVAAVPPITSATAVPPPPTALTREGPRALLVDDEVIQLELLAQLFEEAGFAVETASGGGRALERIAATNWDLVVTDQMMPDVDGWSILRRARAARPATPVILLSAVAPCPPDDLPAGMHFDAVLLKPAASQEILATAWRLLLKVGPGATALDWHALVRLASEGDVSGIEDWIAAARIAAPREETLLTWIERQLHGLNLALLESFARHGGKAA